MKRSVDMIYVDILEEKYSLIESCRKKTTPKLVVFLYCDPTLGLLISNFYLCEG